MSDITDADRDALQEALQASLGDEQLAPLAKKARALADEIVESVEWSMKDYLAANLAYHVKEMAGRAVGAMLDGNQDEMVRWLNCDSRHNGRDRDRPVADRHPIIHGKLFEHGAVLLRRRLVEAHRDLIADERVADLEAQVKSLVEQNNKMRRERDEWSEKARSYMPA